MEQRFKIEILPMKDKLFRLALRITMNRAEAEDAVQETLLKLWSRRDEWDRVSSLEALAMTICRNQSLDYAKRSGRDNLSLDVERDSPVSTRTPLHSLEDKEKRQLLQRLIDSLPEVQRSIFELRESQNRSFAEIAEILGLSETQVRVYLHRARQRIKAEFERVYF